VNGSKRKAQTGLVLLGVALRSKLKLELELKFWRKVAADGVGGPGD
jgi:hypothetical protein